nr:MAG TPA: hypothetical protein [Caudoviricetes sp.]
MTSDFFIFFENIRCKLCSRRHFHENVCWTS